MTIGLNHDRSDHIVGSVTGSDRRVRPWLIGVVALAVIGAFCGIVWYAYSQGMTQGQRGGGVPLLRADATPTRERPAEPGGVKVPHQDKLVYDQVGRAPPPAPAQERILPPPEQPMVRPVAPPPPPVAVAPPTPAPAISAPAVLPAPPTARTPTPAAPAAPPAAAAPRAPSPAAPPPVLALPTPAPPTAVPPVQTARVPSPPAAVAEPPSSPGSGPGGFRVQLAAVREAAAAQREWEKLKSAHGEVLGRLTGQVVRVDLGEPRGVFYRIQAGPLGDAEAARKACATLKERNVGCLVVRP